MARDNDLLDMVMSAVRYAFSNMIALLIGGIVIALSLLVIGLPFFLGYITRCMREIVKGNGVMPEWDEIGQMFVDGIRMTGVFCVYAFLYLVIVMVPGVPVLVFNYMNIPILALFSTLVMAMTAAVALCLGAIAFFASWIIYANTGSVRKAINLRTIFEFMSSDPHRFLEVLVASAAVAVAGMIAMTLVVTIPWALFAVCAAMTFTYSKFYQDTMKTTAQARDWR